MLKLGALLDPNAATVLTVAGLGLTGALIGVSIPKERKTLGAVVGLVAGAGVPLLFALFVTRAKQPDEAPA
jgi:hypothetical protein